MSVSGPESYILSARLGLGLVQMPNFHAVDDLARGTLVRVLSEFQPPAVPVSLLYPPTGNCRHAYEFSSTGQRVSSRNATRQPN
jgi:DNA-binding transcriptional LysR family regulator